MDTNDNYRKVVAVDSINQISPQYIAGVADSDGSFTITKRKTKNNKSGFTYTAMFQLSWKESNITKKTISKIQKRYGGHIVKYKHKNSFSNCSVIKYVVEGVMLDKLLLEISPFLVLKKARAKLLQKLREICKRNHYNLGRLKPIKVLKYQEKLYKKCKNL